MMADRSPSAWDTLLAIHKYLFPERYDDDVPLGQWTTETIERVAAMVEDALRDDPRARLAGMAPADLI